MNYLNGNNIAEYLANTPQITFEITERCNLSCVYCGYGKMYSNKYMRKGRELPLDKAITLLQYLKNLWDAGYNTQGESNIIISFYGGEPLLNMPFIYGVVNYIENNLSKYNKTFIFSMTTNAILLPRYMDYLVEKKFKILISLDGDENGSSLRVFPNGQPAFGKITDAIEQLREKYPYYFESSVEFNAVLSNRTSVKDITEYIYTHYHKSPTISEINTDGVNLDEIELFKSIFQDKWKSTMEMNKDLSELPFWNNPNFERVARYILMHSPYAYMDYNELLFNSQQERKRLPTGTCLPFTKKIFVTVSGKIMPCERISYKYQLGTIKNQNVDIDFEAIAQMYNSYYDKVQQTCRKCFNHKGCLCCMFNNGQLESHSAQCSYFVTSIDNKSMQMEVNNFLRKYPEAYSYIMQQYEVIL